MRKVLKAVGWVFAGLVGLVVIGLVTVYIASGRMIAKHVTVPVTIAAIDVPEGNPVAIARGEYLVDHVIGCKECHGADFGGHAPVDNAMIGRLWAPNLTPGSGSVTRGFTSVDWQRAIRHGVAADGHRLILMPSADMVNFNDTDVASIIAYVKSMPPVDRADGGIHVGPLGRTLLVAGQIHFAFDEIDHARLPPVAAEGPTAEWGQTLSGACSGCHGPSFSGGPIPGGDPSWPPARNLTPDATGLKGWTFETFDQAFRHGRLPDGKTLSPVMPWQSFAGMTDPDVHALWAFLQTLPAKAAGGR